MREIAIGLTVYGNGIPVGPKESPLTPRVTSF